MHLTLKCPKLHWTSPCSLWVFGCHVVRLKAGTHQPNRWMSEAFGETRTRLGTNMFGVFSCVGSFRSRVDVVCSDSTCKIWRGGPSDVWVTGFSDCLCASWMAVLIGGVLANQRSVWEGWNTVCALFFYALRSVIPRFHVLQCWQETSCYVCSGQINLCSFGKPCWMFSMQLCLSEIVKFHFGWK